MALTHELYATIHVVLFRVSNLPLFEHTGQSEMLQQKNTASSIEYIIRCRFMTRIDGNFLAKKSHCSSIEFIKPSCLQSVVPIWHAQIDKFTIEHPI